MLGFPARTSGDRSRRIVRLASGLLFAAMLALSAPGLVHAADITVTTTTVNEVDDGECSLIEAIVAANSNAPYFGCPGGNDNNDRIFLQAGQTYQVTAIHNTAGIEKGNGLPIVTGELVIRGNDATIQRASADEFRFLYATAPLTVRDLTFRDAYVDWSGGAIYAAAPLSVTNSRFLNNTITGFGGAIYQRDAGLVVRDSLFQGNSADGGGGALRTEQDAVIVNTDFFTNTGATNYGAASAVLGAQVRDSEFRYNRALSGDGGALFTQGQTVLTRTTFISNTATSSGGAVSVRGAGIRIADSLFQDNFSEQSAAGVSAGKEIVIVNSDFLSNTAGFLGGAVSANAGTSGPLPENHVTVDNSRFRYNRTTSGSGAAIFTRGAFMVSNSSFVSNMAYGNGGAIDGTGIANVTGSEFLYNASEDGTGGAINNLASEFDQTSSIADSRFIGNRSYRSGGAINSSYRMAVENVLFERNRVEEEFSSGGGLSVSNAVDIADSRFMTNTSPYGGGGLNSGPAQIMDSHFENNYARYQGGGADTEAAVIVSTRFISNTAAEFTNAASGGGALHAIGSVDVTDSLFELNVAGHDGGAVWAREPMSLTRTSFSFNRSDSYGGAVHSSGPATVSRSDFLDNEAAQFGGALYVGDELALTGSSFVRNVSGSIGGAIAALGPATIHDAELLRNEAAERGGGIVAADPLTLTYTLVQLNSSGDQGGGVAVDEWAYIDEATFADNFAKFDGGGLFVRGSGSGLSRIVNTIFTDNYTDGKGNDVKLLSTIPGVGTGSVELVHSTIATSRVFTGSGVYIGGSPGGVVDIVNTIIAGHETGVEISVPPGGGATFSSDYNLFDNGINVNPGQPLGANSLTGEAGFVNRAARDFHLLITSPAVDAGTDAGVTVDWDRDARPQGAGFDIGADEVLPCIALTGVRINGPGSGAVDTNYVFSAALSPVDAAQPVDYAWSPEPSNGQGTPRATYRWSQTGDKTVRVQASNCGGAAEARRSVRIGDESSSQRVLLPSVVK